MRLQPLKSQEQSICPFLYLTAQLVPGRTEINCFLFGAQIPDTTSLPFCAAELNIHHPGMKGPRKLEFSKAIRVPSVENSYEAGRTLKG